MSVKYHLCSFLILFVMPLIGQQNEEEKVKFDLVLERFNAIPANDRVEDIYVKDDMVWFGGLSGVKSYNNSSSTLASVVSGPGAVSVKVNRKGVVYTAFKNNKIYIDDKEFFHLKEQGVVITDIELYKGKIWIATNNGIYLVSNTTGKQLRTYNTSNSKLKSNQVNFIKYFKKLDNLWVGTSSGVNEIRSDESWNKTDFSKENFIAVTESIDGLWLLSDKELHLVYEDYGRTRIQPQGLKKGLFKGTVNDLALDKNDNLYVASDILTRYNPYTDKLDQYGESLGLVASKCLSLASDNTGALWLGTENAGLYRIYKDSITINEMVITTILENPISCPGAMDGSIKVEVSGGQAPYKYFWERVRLKGESNPKNLKSGNYKVTVEDDFGTRKTASIAIDEPRPIKINVSKIEATSAPGKKDGKAEIDPFGGTAPYDVLWGNGETGLSARKLNFGFAYLTVTDANGCSIVETIKVPKPKILPDLDIAKIRVGQTLNIDNLFFVADSSSITDISFEVLDEVYEFMADHDKVVIEIGGHTNNIPPDDYCDRLSTARAKAVADYLTDRGIEADRISYKGYGKRNPIASNRSSAGRRKNQRVEIKIVRIESD